MKAVGRWAWLNNYSIPVTAELIRRARMVEGVIIKYGMLTERFLLEAASIRWAVEAYVTPGQTQLQGEQLADWYDQGAEFIVINAEAEWEQESAHSMQTLISVIRNHTVRGDPEIYASVDTRGGRTSLPYQKVLRNNAVAWMPMIYPKAFQQSVPAAFVSSLDRGQDFGDIPVIPTIQTYDEIGRIPVTRQLAEIERRNLPGCQAYTIGHATPEEWQEFVQGYEKEDTDDMWLDQKIIGFDGQPVLFEVLVGGPPSYPTQKREMAHKEWIQASEFGLLIQGSGDSGSSTVPPHSHSGQVIVS